MSLKLNPTYFQDALREHAASFRWFAVRAGADATVPTCPEWDVLQLIRHLARVYAMVSLAIERRPEDGRPQVPHAPEEFEEALCWWGDVLDDLVPKLSISDSRRPVWAFFPGGDIISWSRRMAHETAIHRLDAELAAGTGPERGHGLLFDSRLAANGVDEVLTTLLPKMRDWPEEQASGRVLYHAADAEHAWLVTFRAGELPDVQSPHESGLEVDTTVAGTADALYRRVWGRPSNAVVSGDPALAELIAGR